MKLQKMGPALTGAFGAASLAGLTMIYLGLHDIWNDYASRSVWEKLAPDAARALPEWSACALEWKAVAMGFWLCVSFHILYFARIIISLARKGRTGE